jgi:hypothetical protein
MDGDFEGLRMLLPKGQQAFTVRIIAHDDLAIIATLNDVVRVTCDGETGLAGHGVRSISKHHLNGDHPPCSEASKTRKISIC